MDAPDLTGARTFRVQDSDSVDRWHVLADGETVVYERRPGEFEAARVVTASALLRGDVWVEVSSEG